VIRACKHQTIVPYNKRHVAIDRKAVNINVFIHYTLCVIVTTAVEGGDGSSETEARKVSVPL
jgi:hypothetical protein